MRVTRSIKEAISLGAVALIVGVNMIELLPNATLEPWTWLLAGALLGWSEARCAVAQHEKARPSSQRFNRSRAELNTKFR